MWVFFLANWVVLDFCFLGNCLAVLSFAVEVVVVILILSSLRGVLLFLSSQTGRGVDFDFSFGFFLLAVELLLLIFILSASASSSLAFSQQPNRAWSYLDFASGSAELLLFDFVFFEEYFKWGMAFSMLALVSLSIVEMFGSWFWWFVGGQIQMKEVWSEWRQDEWEQGVWAWNHWGVEFICGFVCVDCDLQ